MEHSEYRQHDAIGLGELIRSGAIRPDEVLEAALARVAAANPVVNAVVHLMVDQARDQIARHDSSASPLAGVPYLLKDLTTWFAGAPTTYGSRFWKDFVPDVDTEVAARLRRGGLVVFGKTNTPELGGSPNTEPRLFGSTRNPWNIAHSAGGSSGGASAAVAAEMVPAAHASDGGGSIRIPASCCGLFGLKPSRGRNSAGPVLGEQWVGMSAEHAVTRSVRDSAALLDITSGPAPGDPYACPAPERPFLEEVTRSPGRLRIAASTQRPEGLELHPEAVAAYEDAIQLCADLGHDVIEAEPTYDLGAVAASVVKIIAVHYAHAIAKRAAVVGREPGPDDLEVVIHKRLQVGRGVSATEYVHAVETIHGAGRQIGAFMRDVDVILRPTVAHPAPPLGYLDMNADDLDEYLRRVWSYIPFTAVFNATGQPAMSVPLHWTADGLPLGVQFAARYGDEATLFRLAGQLEQARPWFDRRPDDTPVLAGSPAPSSDRST